MFAFFSFLPPTDSVSELQMTKMCELRLKYEREIQTIVSVTFCDANEQYLKPVGILRDSSFLIGLVTTPGELKKRN